MEERLAESIPQEHKEIFDRVWQRVMNGSPENSPVTWGAALAARENGDTSASPAPPVTSETPSAPMEPVSPAPPIETPPETPTETPTQPPAEGETPPDDTATEPSPPPVTVLPCPDPPVSDFPQGNDIGVLGSSCMEWAPLLQELIRRCLSEQKEYMRLARRVGGAAAKVFALLAREKLRQAKRLSAAYFLISGVRYWPQDEEAPVTGSYLGVLRRRFRREQEDMAACLAGAEGSSDPSLSQLFRDIAKEDWEAAGKIRTLVEQA